MCLVEIHLLLLYNLWFLVEHWVAHDGREDVFGLKGLLFFRVTHSLLVEYCLLGDVWGQTVGKPVTHWAIEIKILQKLMIKMVKLP